MTRVVFPDVLRAVFTAPWAPVTAAKNLILAGPRSVTVYDPEPAVITDLQSDYYLRPEQVGTRRDVASLPPLRELNEYVITKKLEIEGELTEEILAGFHVVVVTGALPIPGPKLAAWSAFCHANKIGFISTALRGLAGSVFVDFGPDHTIFDKDGELCKSAIVTNILRTPEGVATVFTHDAKRHGFEDGDFVVFREIDGTPEFNDGKPRRITNTKMFSFDLAEPWTGSVGAMSGSGVVEQVKVTSKLEQFPLSHVTLNPVHPKEGSMLFTDYAKMTRPSQLHVAFNALQQFADEQGRLPGIRNAADAAAVVALAKAFVASSSEVCAPLLGCSVCCVRSLLC